MHTTDNRVKGLKEDLYYDLLDKYVQLLADNKKLVLRDKILSARMSFYHHLNEEDGISSKQCYNQMIASFIQAADYNGTDYEKTKDFIRTYYSTKRGKTEVKCTK